ncbi:hypothetical protein EYZ11_000674 [Aspergillus tanneri]|nr:hypothetical protein EYZ11_000674 [Aspergillus tanneri]
MYLLNLAKAPPVLLYIYMYLRPVIEIRLYRLIRRRLPKPTVADELSIKVAFENDLIDWMVPTLGRRSEEESRRNSMTLVEDIMYEVNFLRRWVLSWFGFKSQRVAQASEQAADARHRRDWLESLPLSIEQLQNERQSLSRQLQLQSTVPPPPEEVIRAHGAVPRSQSQDPGGDFNGNRVLSNEENPISLSPAEMSADDFPELAPMGRVNTMSPVAGSSNHADDAGPSRLEDLDAAESGRHSRSNTLFSRPSSPATSSPTSPRVRASLIHQNSDVITMQLELLGNRHASNQGQLIARTDVEADQANASGIPVGRRSFSDLLDALLANQGQSFTAVNNPDTVDSDGLSNMTAAIFPEVGETPLTNADQPRSPRAETPAVGSGPISTLANILPDSVEEPGPEEIHNESPGPDTSFENDFDSEIFPRISDPNVRQSMTATITSPIAHRVTILSSHPVDSLASHLASMLTNVIFIPLESLYLRSLASSYLSSANSSAALRSDVRPLGVWGGGSRSDAFVYMGKLALTVGMQAAVNASVWGIIAGTAIKIGRKFCGWGSL